MSGNISYNGKLMKNKADMAFLGNRLFRYGDGFFESMRLHQGSLPLWDFHLARIEQSLDLLEMEIICTKNALKKAIFQLLEANNHQREARIRLAFFREGGGLYTPEGHRAAFWIETEEKQATASFLQPQKAGGRIGFFEKASKQPHPWSGIKSSNAQLYVMAALERKKQDWAEILISNNAGNIIEASASNLFIRKGDKMFTPPLSDGCVAGCMRAYLLKNNPNITSHSLHKEDLLQADEIWLTNAVAGIRIYDKTNIQQ